MKKSDQIMKSLLTGDSRNLIKAAMDEKPSQKRSIARGLMMIGDWEESQHPRGKGGKFTKKGGGGATEGSKSGGESMKSGKPDTSQTSTGHSGKTNMRARENWHALQVSNRSMAKECARRAKEWPEGSQERHTYEMYADILSKPLTGRPTLEESRTMTQKFLSNISSQLKPAAVERYKKDLANEPQITSDLCDISDQIGAGMFGLGFRLKKASDSSDGRCRIADKIAENIDEAKKAGRDMSYEESVAQLSDMVRYTQACTTDNLVSNFEKTTAHLAKKGYKTVKIKNSWESYNLDRPYRGINCVFESPSGTRFELQFHTAESLVGKEVQHGQYEEQRNPDTADDRKQELGQLMYNNMSRMTAPRDIGRIKPYPPK